MPDREKVTKGLECCIKNDHKTCSYKSEDKGITATPCTTFLMRDALALINEQSNIIEKYHKADSFLFAHGWRWTDD